MLHSKLIVIVTLFGLAASNIVMDPINPTLRWGQVIKMRCRAPWSIYLCIWGYAEKEFEHSVGNLEDGECEYDLEMPVTNKTIEISCKVYQNRLQERGVIKSEKTATTVITVVLPKIRLACVKCISSDKISVMAGEESALTCTVEGARPKPDILWKIGNPIRNRSVC